MRRSDFRYAWLITLLIGTALACNFLNGIRNIQEIRKTGQAVITEVKGFVTENAPMLETARALVTTEGGSILKTAEAFATDNPGLLETAKAFATQELPELRQTLEALATDYPELDETLKAVATDQPNLQETFSAIATRYAGGAPATGEIPDDIPLVDQNTIADLSVVGGLISYNTSLDFQAVLSFYQEQMPVKGWKANEEMSMVTGSTAMLIFEKPDRSATIIITADASNEQVAVVIQSSPK